MNSKKNVDITTAVLYAVNAYNNCIINHLKLTPFEIINSHTKSKAPITFEPQFRFISLNVQDYRQDTEKLYDSIAEKVHTHKEAYIAKKNETKHAPIDYSQEKHVYNML